MGYLKKPIRTLPCLVLIAAIALTAGCSHNAPTTQPAQTLQSAGNTGQTLQTASASVQPYTVVDQLPAKPAVVEDNLRDLHLTYHSDHYCLEDSDGDYYDCARDAGGNLYPCYYDHESDQYCPLYFDGERDSYYCVVREDGRFYRRYWSHPYDLYYDDQYDYNDYRPQGRDRPVVYVQNNYYGQYSSFNRPRYSHRNNGWMAAIPVVAVAYLAFANNGHHAHSVRVAHNPPPRPAAIYRAAPANSRPMIVSQRQTGISRQASAQRPASPGRHAPTFLARGARPIPAVPAGRRVATAPRPFAPPAKRMAATSRRFPPPAKRMTAARPPNPPARSMFAHRQTGPRMAAKPAPARPMRVATAPAKPFGRRPILIRKPMENIGGPVPRPGQRIARQSAPRPTMGTMRRVAQRPLTEQRRPMPVQRSRPVMQMVPQPAPMTASRPAPRTRPAGLPVYHRAASQNPAPAAQAHGFTPRAAAPTRPAPRAAPTNPGNGNRNPGNPRKKQQPQ